MGGSLYSSHLSRTREAEYKTKSREEIFVQQNIHIQLSPFGLKVREARDSEAHPNAVPIIIALDVTGSMGRIPEDLIKNHFSNMMEFLINNGVPDAAICFCAIGDHITDRAPLQVGQFESGDIELTGDLTKIWLEGRGGGQKMESYMLTWLFAARHTATDAFDKRNQKGFLFTIGDEWNHPIVNSKALCAILGYEQGSPDEKSELLLKEAQERWNVYHIHCTDGSFGSVVSDRWKEMLGENLIMVDSKEITKAIASIVTSHETITNNSTENVDSSKITQFI